VVKHLYAFALRSVGSEPTSSGQALQNLTVLGLMK